MTYPVDPAVAAHREALEGAVSKAAAARKVTAASRVAAASKAVAAVKVVAAAVKAVVAAVKAVAASKAVAAVNKVAAVKAVAASKAVAAVNKVAAVKVVNKVELDLAVAAKQVGKNSLAKPSEVEESNDVHQKEGRQKAGLTSPSKDTKAAKR